MNDNGYVYQLKTLRVMEKRTNKDYTDRAQAVYASRLASIEASKDTPEAKERQRANAYRLWTVFMQREMPANG